MDNPNLNYNTFSRQLLTEIPEFRSIYDEHMKNNFNELLPSVLIDDFYHFLVTVYRRSISNQGDAENCMQIIGRSVNLLNSALGSSDEDLRQLILMFLENLDPREGDYQDIKSFLSQGSNLGEAIRTYYSHYG